MWINFIKIARRKLWNKKWNSFTKLFSLSVGIISLFFIAIYIYQELSFDTFHHKQANIFKINTAIKSPTGDIPLGLTAIPVGTYAQSVSPEVLEFVRINKEYGSHAIRYGDRLFSESENIYYADPTFFELFDFELLSGNGADALQGPDKVTLTETTALKYFGSTDVLGKILLYDELPFTVSGVLRDLPSNSHLQFDFLISMDTFMGSRPPDVDQNWTWFPMNTYVLLKDAKAAKGVLEKLRSIPQYLPENSPQDQYVLSLEPLDGLHFSSVKLGELGPKGKMTNIYVLVAIGFMIMMLALSNFINLTTAQVSLQGNEVCIKKTMGASKSDIFKQFFVESMLLTCLATLISVVFILLTFPAFEQFMGTGYDVSFLVNPLTLLALPLIPMLLSFLGGIYPAFKFANIATNYVPKATGKQGNLFNTRTSLVIFQFCITSAMIICSLIIYYQLNFLQHRDMGVDLARKMVIDYGPNGAIGNAYESLKKEFSDIHGVEYVSFSSHVPGQMPNGVATKLLDINGRSSNGEINLNLVDHDFIDDYRLRIVAGRDFYQGQADQTNALILNEAAVKAFGYENPEDILGASFEQWGGNGKVIGVVKDFNYMSLHEDIGLLSLKVWPEQFSKITLQLAEDDLQETMRNLETKWTSKYPGIPFNYYFVDDNFKAQYDKDRQFSGIITLFAIISICIGILGLIAYATFWCERRRKEMSIRKVLGAEVQHLVWKLYQGFSIPVLIGFILAIPISYYLGTQWLQEFAYRFELNWHFFLFPLLLLLVFVWIAVGTQTLKLVLANPVDHLKEE